MQTRSLRLAVFAASLVAAGCAGSSTGSGTSGSTGQPTGGAASGSTTGATATSSTGATTASSASSSSSSSTGSSATGASSASGSSGTSASGSSGASGSSSSGSSTSSGGATGSSSGSTGQCLPLAGAQDVYPVAQGLSSLVAVDSDGDGRLDLVTVDAAPPGALRFFLGASDGGFVDGGVVDLGGAAIQVATGDFDGDGRPDFAASVGSSIALLLRVDGGFAVSTLSPNAGTVAGVAVGDLTGDGLDDIEFETTSLSGWTFASCGDGGFVDAGQHGIFASYPALGDPNGDGRLDVLLPEVLGAEVTVGLNTGGGALALGASWPTDPAPRQLASADLNHDGALDLVVTTGAVDAGGPAPVGGVNVLLGAPDGGFQPALRVDVGSTTVVVATADLDGDGNLDLVVGSADALHMLAVVPGYGDGGFGPALYLGTGGRVMSLATGELNGDGQLDVAAATNTGLAVYHGGTCP